MCDQRCSFCRPVLSAMYAALLRAGAQTQVTQWLCIIFVDGCTCLVATLAGLIGAYRAFVSMTVVIVGRWPSAGAASHMSSEQLPFPHVVSAQAGVWQFAICMFGKFDGRNFTRCTFNLHLCICSFTLLRFSYISFTIST